MRTVSTGAGTPPVGASNMDMTLTLGGVAAEYTTASIDGTRPCQTPASTLLAASVRVSWHSAMMGHHSQAEVAQLAACSRAETGSPALLGICAYLI